MRPTIIAIVLWLAAASAAAQSKPPVPAGPPTRGLAVAFLTAGVDYTRPSLARRLARDGEGDMIGYDAVDRDAKPYANEGEDTRLAELSPVLLVPIRIDTANPDTIKTAFEYLRRTPARIVVIPSSPIGKAAEALAAAITTTKDTFYVIAASDKDLDLPREHRDHVLTVGALRGPVGSASSGQVARQVDLILAPAAALRESPGTNRDLPVTSAEAAILLMGHFICAAKDLAVAQSPADVKRILLAKAHRDPAHAAPLLEVCALR